MAEKEFTVARTEAGCHAETFGIVEHQNDLVGPF